MQVQRKAALPQLAPKGLDRSRVRRLLREVEFRHTMAKQFLADTGNDLVSLAQILGHEILNAISRYSQRSYDQLAAIAERLNY